MDAVRTLLLTLQKNIVMRRVLIIWLFQAVEVLLVLSFAYVFYRATTDFDSVALFMLETGFRLGEVAVVLYALTLIPGIVTRLQWWPQITQPVASMILPFRRHLGILMFLLVYVHMNFTTSLPLLAANNFDASKIQLLFFQQMGYFAWLSLLPLWLTSNDVSQKFLGKWWKRIHKLTYIALFLIFMHVVLIQSNWMLLVGAVGVLEIVSWVRVWMRGKVQPVAKNVAPEESSVSTPGQVAKSSVSPDAQQNSS